MGVAGSGTRALALNLGYSHLVVYRQGDSAARQLQVRNPGLPLTTCENWAFLPSSGLEFQQIY